MNPGIEKLESLVANSSTDSSAVDKFFRELWSIGATLPGIERRNLVRKMDEVIQSLRPVNKNYLGTIRLAYGFIDFHEGNYELSLKQLAEARKLFEEVKDEIGLQCATAMTGFNYRTLGELELALKCLFDAYAFLSGTNVDKIWLVFCVYNLAEIYSETKQYEESLRFYELTCKLTEENGNRHMLSRALNGIGVVFQHQKKYAMALDYFTKSLNLSDELKNLPVKARVLTDLGLYYFELEDYKMSAGYQEKALQIRRELNIPNGMVTNMEHLSELYFRENKPDEAVSMLLEALKIAEEIKVKPKMFQIHLMLSGIYQSKNELVKSLFHYKIFYSIREEVQHEDNEKKIKNLKLIFEAEQTKKENAVIKAQKEEIQRKNSELQETIDELTITRVSRKAKALTLVLAVILFIAEDPFDYIASYIVTSHNYFLTLLVKLAFILSLNPINNAIEHYLLKRVILKKKQTQEALIVS